MYNLVMQEEDFATILDLENQVTFLILEHFVTNSENKPYYNLMKTAIMDQLTSDKSKPKDGDTCDASPCQLNPNTFIWC